MRCQEVKLQLIQPLQTSNDAQRYLLNYFVACLSFFLMQIIQGKPLRLLLRVTPPFNSKDAIAQEAFNVMLELLNDYKPKGKTIHEVCGESPYPYFRLIRRKRLRVKLTSLIQAQFSFQFLCSGCFLSLSTFLLTWVHTDKQTQVGRQHACTHTRFFWKKNYLPLNVLQTLMP